MAAAKRAPGLPPAAGHAELPCEHALLRAQRPLLAPLCGSNPPALRAVPVADRPTLLLVAISLTELCRFVGAVATKMPGCQPAWAGNH